VDEETEDETSAFPVLEKPVLESATVAVEDGAKIEEAVEDAAAGRAATLPTVTPPVEVDASIEPVEDVATSVLPSEPVEDN
jgi:hypothetical protein